MKFGKYDVPDSWLWVAALLAPVAGAALYHHFHADPTDIVTDVKAGPSATSPSLVIVYNAGPPDTVSVPVTPAVWALQSPIAVSTAKTSLAGLTRDRVRATLQLPA